MFAILLQNKNFLWVLMHNIIPHVYFFLNVNMFGILYQWFLPIKYSQSFPNNVDVYFFLKCQHVLYFPPWKENIHVIRKTLKIFSWQRSKIFERNYWKWHQWITHIVWKEKYSEMSVSGRKIEESMIKGEKKHDATYV